MATTTPPLRLALADALGPAGFTRKSGSWFRRSDEVIEVVNLQRSQWGEPYYLNYALWLRALGELPFPGEHTCHVRWRAEDVMGRDAPLARLLDLEYAVKHSRGVAPYKQSTGVAGYESLATDGGPRALSVCTLFDGGVSAIIEGVPVPVPAHLQGSREPEPGISPRGRSRRGPCGPCRRRRAPRARPAASRCGSGSAGAARSPTAEPRRLRGRPGFADRR